jgi:hypothetical protein
VVSVAHRLHKVFTLPSGKTLTVDLPEQRFTARDDAVSKADKRAILKILVDFYQRLLDEA